MKKNQQKNQQAAILVQRFQIVCAEIKKSSAVMRCNVNETPSGHLVEAYKLEVLDNMSVGIVDILKVDPQGNLQTLSIVGTINASGSVQPCAMMEKGANEVFLDGRANQQDFTNIEILLGLTM